MVRIHASIGLWLLTMVWSQLTSASGSKYQLYLCVAAFARHEYDGILGLDNVSNTEGLRLSFQLSVPAIECVCYAGLVSDTYLFLSPAIPLNYFTLLSSVCSSLSPASLRSIPFGSTSRLIQIPSPCVDVAVLP
ncbi:hypothetical protein IW262DRAFT_484338 [Armillaria fumosa]|nr:hypothetical protein IW262DRAFT_484338 [Armillaria fumosa]